MSGSASLRSRSAAALLPASLLGAVLVAAPFAGTTTMPLVVYPGSLGAEPVPTAVAGLGTRVPTPAPHRAGAVHPGPGPATPAARPGRPAR